MGTQYTAFNMNLQSTFSSLSFCLHLVGREVSNKIVGYLDEEGVLDKTGPCSSCSGVKLWTTTWTSPRKRNWGASTPKSSVRSTASRRQLLPHHGRPLQRGPLASCLHPWCSRCSQPISQDLLETLNADLTASQASHILFIHLPTYLVNRHPSSAIIRQQAKHLRFKGERDSIPSLEGRGPVWEIDK